MFNAIEEMNGMTKMVSRINGILVRKGYFKTTNALLLKVMSLDYVEDVIDNGLLLDSPLNNDICSVWLYSCPKN